MEDISYQESREHHSKRPRRLSWKWILSIFDKFMDKLEADWLIVRRESDIFLGATLFSIGLLNFHSGKYCDGNAADYLSCTRPVTYYYYTWIEIGLVILGVYLILLWFLQRERR